MKTRRNTSSIMLVLLIFIFCCQSTWAGVVFKQGKPKNSTNASKEVTSTTKHPKVIQKVKNTSTTLSPEVEISKPSQIDLDGRSSFINNQYVADEDSITNDTPSLYENLQQQMEAVLSNTGNNEQVYPDTPQLKGIINDDNEGDKHNLHRKPLFSYNVQQFDEYDEEDAEVEDTTDTEEQPENCEDTEESLTVNDDTTNYAGVSSQTSASNQNSLQNSYGQSSSAQYVEQNNPGKNPYDSSNYAPQTNKPVQNPQAEFSQNSYGQSNPSEEAIHKLAQNTFGQLKPKPLTETNQPNNYGQLKPLEESQKLPQNNYGYKNPLEQHKQSNQKPTTSYEVTKIQQSPKPHRHSSKFPQNYQKPNITPSQNHFSNQNSQQQNKPNDSKKTLQNNNKTVNNGNSITPSLTNSFYDNTNPTLSLSSNSSYGNSNPGHPSPSNLTYDNLNLIPLLSYPSFGNTNPSNLLHPNSSYGLFSSTPLSSSNSLFDTFNPAFSSPFSTIFSNNKTPNNNLRRHLKFSTVASSSQFVSTPLADLMLKFSISMAKPLRSVNNNVNQAQNYNRKS